MVRRLKHKDVAAHVATECPLRLVACSWPECCGKLLCARDVHSHEVAKHLFVYAADGFDASDARQPSFVGRGRPEVTTNERAALLYRQLREVERRINNIRALAVDPDAYAVVAVEEEQEEKKEDTQDAPQDEAEEEAASEGGEGGGGGVADVEVAAEVAGEAAAEEEDAATETTSDGGKLAVLEEEEEAEPDDDEGGEEAAAAE